MNQLPTEKREQIVMMLCEGSSMRTISRVCNVSRNTINKLLVEVGQAAIWYHDNHVKNVRTKRVQADEIWSFVYAKAKNVPHEKQGEAGDVWTWTGIDADSKLIISWYVGNRDAESANEFMRDVASRLANRVQLTTDGLKAYLDAVEDAFPQGIDFAQLVKIYESNTIEETRRYSPVECVGCKKTPVIGSPDPDHISTSYVERQNLTMRMHMRRFTRLTNGFSKKLENHCHALALYFFYYNWCKIHKTLRTTPAMAAGLTDDIKSIKDILKVVYGEC